MNGLKDTYKLVNGAEIPCVGFGTWQTPSGKAAEDSVREAIKAGYRLIDTAAVYGNEKSVAKGVKNSGVPREEIFVTSKLWNSERGYDRAMKAFDKTMREMELDYLDMYLIHWPVPAANKKNWQETNPDTWRALETLYKEKQIKAIGVSNFMPRHIENLIENCEIAPMVNQIELHPGHTQNETVAYCRSKGIVLEAWGPMGTGRLLNEPALKRTAEKYGKSVAQICIRWSLQKGYIPLPKSVRAERIKENARVFDFEITPEDMKTLDDMDGAGYSGLDPDNADF